MFVGFDGGWEHKSCDKKKTIIDRQANFQKVPQTQS